MTKKLFIFLQKAQKRLHNKKNLPKKQNASYKSLR